MSQSNQAQPQTLSQALDEVRISRFHVRALLTAGMGFFTDAYDLFIIGVALALIKVQWNLSPTEVALLGSITLLATLAGAIVFGRIADLWGRKAVYGLEAGIMALGAIASAFAPSFIWLVIARFVLGLGIGGDYPVSGVIMSEYSNRSNRGRLVSLVFSMQAVGLVVGPLVALGLLGMGVNHDLAWRLMLGLGAVPALAVIYLRRTLPESPRYVAKVRGQGEAAATSVHSYSKGLIQAPGRDRKLGPMSLSTMLSNRRTLTMLLGTAGSWFLLDYAYYGNTISTPLVLRTVAPESTLIQAVAWSLAIFAIAAVPGYLLALLTIDRIGHRRLQWIGFLVMGAAFATIGLVPGLTHEIVPFLMIYGLSYFFTEFGPNVTTFVIPTEIYPINARTTGHGLSAGIGKLGAFIGVFIFPLLTARLGLNGTLVISAGFACAGALLTQVLPEVRGVSLDEADLAEPSQSLAAAPSI